MKFWNSVSVLQLVLCIGGMILSVYAYSEDVFNLGETLLSYLVCILGLIHAGIDLLMND